VSILRDRNRLRIENGSIAKGEKIPLHFFDPETDLNVSIRMEGTHYVLSRMHARKHRGCRC
jgi:hypothetical protein